MPQINLPRAFLAITTLIAVAGCKVDGLLGSGSFSVGIGIGKAGVGALSPAAVQLGDTIPFVATEMCRNALAESDCPADPSSDVAPNDYVWSVNDSSRAQVVSPGQIVFRRLGPVTISAATGRASSSAVATVVPRMKTFGITPNSLSLVVGDTASVLVAARDSLGAPIVEIRGSPMVQFFASPFSANNPVAGTNGADSTRTYLKAVSAGTVRYAATVSVWGATNLRDTLVIVVRPP